MAEIIVALDVPSGADALALVDRLGDDISFYKVGSPLFTRCGHELVRDLRQRGKRVFLDLKYHDIPSTVAHAVAAAAELDVELVTLHASGGDAMMRAARAAAGDHGPRLLGVTILTSFTAVDVENVWAKEVFSVRDEVTRLTALAVEAGLHGVVASPLEVESLKRRHGAELMVVTPGIRAAGDRLGDQARTATPAEAVRAGADYLVVGRPVLEAADPVAVVRTMLADIAGTAAVS
ncbi:MAG TPA: orotidine-5'-phosphate decarboxylase [Longimicrobiales bacterium]|nr:orotidine-5'-phosphate decarboxylase [Longimicrobiales bacterium]